jgi:hypothetical protein
VQENKKVIIGFGYKRERGKDTSCDYITKNYHGFVKDSFARSLKEGIGKGVFGLSHDQLYGKGKSVVDPFWQMTPREILQLAGTEAMRKTFGEKVWVNTLLRRFQNQEFSMLVSDMRFISEAEAIKEAGGYVVNIIRKIPFNAEVDLHLSETELDDYDDWDYEIDNNGTIKGLYLSLQTIMREILCEEI